MSKKEAGQTVEQSILTFSPVFSVHINHRNIHYYNSHKVLNYWFIQNIFVNQSCVSSGDSELGRVSSGWITSPSLSKFGGSEPQDLQTCPFSVEVCSLGRRSRF